MDILLSGSLRGVCFVLFWLSTKDSEYTITVGRHVSEHGLKTLLYSLFQGYRKGPTHLEAGPHSTDLVLQIPQP